MEFLCEKKPWGISVRVSVASLGLVSAGAATDGVIPFFPEKILTSQSAK